MKQLTITGNVGKTPELKHTKDGRQMLVFSVGVYKDKDNTDWVNVIAMGDKRIAYLTDKLEKGSRITAIGTPEVNAYIKDGVAVGSQTLFLNEIDVHTKKSTPSEKITPDIPF